MEKQITKFNSFTKDAQLKLIAKTIAAGYSIEQLVNSKGILYNPSLGLKGTVHVNTGENESFALNFSAEEASKKAEVVFV